jgi:hypothetical protein
MNEPIYQIGDRLPYSNHIVRGRMRLRNGTYRYLLQIGDSDNSQVVNSTDIDYLKSYTPPCPDCNSEFCKCG